MSADPDRPLLDACIAGERPAWEAFVRRFTHYVYYLNQLTARRCGATLSDAEQSDLHNDLFLALLEDDRRRLRAFAGLNGCSVRSWVRVITVRRALDHLRRRKVHLSLDDAGDGTPSRMPADDAPDALERLLARGDEARHERLAGLAASLNPSDRLLLEMIYVRKLSPEAIAAAFHTSRGAVYTRKTRLIQRLRTLAGDAGLLDEA